jgi:hypothetical protein
MGRSVTVYLPGVIEDEEHLNKNSQTLAEILTHYLQNGNFNSLSPKCEF